MMNTRPDETLGKEHPRGRRAHDLIAVSIQYEYDPDDLATKNTTQLVHKSNSKTCV